SLDGKFTVSQLRNALSVEQSTDSQAFNISATIDTPGDAQNIVNSVITEFEKTLIGIYGDDDSNLYVVSSATFNPSPVSPNVVQVTIIGGLVGAMIMVAIAFVIELLDSRVKSSDDLADLQMVKLGEIFELSEEQKEHSRVQSTVSTKSRGRRV